MTLATRALPRFRAMAAWANRILRVDLSDMSIRAQETAPYLPDFMGGRGLAHRLLWDEWPEPVDPFDPDCPLMVFGGVLTGAHAPYSGRTNVCTFAPQAYPYRWFTRSSIGGYFGGELKRAGYDGIVVTGASDQPVRILIQDDGVSILPADELWGQSALVTLDALVSTHGKGCHSLTIGPAGERLSRIATIQNGNSSACGQGGFGAVMGAKQLKAITVVGSGKVTLADPDRVREITRLVGIEARTTRSIRDTVRQRNESLAAEGGGRVRPYACTEGCLSPCNMYYEDVPGTLQSEKASGHWCCVGSYFQGMPRSGRWSLGRIFDWKLGTSAGLEINHLTNSYGLNQWDLIVAMVPWLESCQAAGLIDEINGRPMDWLSPEFWASFLRDLTYREGLGDALAEGGWVAARQLQLGERFARRYYNAWGYGGHWDGHAAWCNPIVYPYWITSALQWMTDTRDPIPSDHSATWYAMRVSPISQDSVFQGGENPVTWEDMAVVSQRLYGNPDVFDPYGAYEGKAAQGAYHSRRGIMKDTLPTDDFVFPLIFSPNTDDHYCRIGDIEGPDVELELFRAGTGVDWDKAEYERAADRVFNLERATTIRHWSRTRAMDEMVIPSYEYPENWTNPLLGERYSLERERFLPVVDEYYRRLGWDVQTGWPTRERLDELGMPGVHGEMVSGAEQARARLPEPPQAEPVAATEIDALIGQGA